MKPTAKMIANAPDIRVQRGVAMVIQKWPLDACARRPPEMLRTYDSGDTRHQIPDPTMKSATAARNQE